MSAVELAEAERATVCICPWTSTAICEGDTHETRCSQHRAAIEAILAARLASTSRRDACITCTRAADTAEAERDEARANRDRLAHENASLRRQVADLTAERDRAVEMHAVAFRAGVEHQDAREAAERALAAREEDIARALYERIAEATADEWTRWEFVTDHVKEPYLWEAHRIVGEVDGPAPQPDEGAEPCEHDRLGCGWREPHDPHTKVGDGRPCCGWPPRCDAPIEQPRCPQSPCCHWSPCTRTTPPTTDAEEANEA